MQQKLFLQKSKNSLITFRYLKKLCSCRFVPVSYTHIIFTIHTRGFRMVWFSCTDTFTLSVRDRFFIQKFLYLYSNLSYLNFYKFVILLKCTAQYISVPLQYILIVLYYLIEIFYEQLISILLSMIEKFKNLIMSIKKLKILQIDLLSISLKHIIIMIAEYTCLIGCKVVKLRV